MAADANPFTDVVNNVGPVVSWIGRKILDSASHLHQTQLSHLMLVLLNLEGKLDDTKALLPNLSFASHAVS